MIQKNVEKLVGKSININIFLDDKYKFSYETHPLSKLSLLKNQILFRLQELSINYKIEYKDIDITQKDDFTLFELFNEEVNEYYDVKLTMNSTLKKYENQKVIMGYQAGTSTILAYRTLSMKFQKLDPNIRAEVSFSKTKKFPYNSRSCNVLNSNLLIITGGVNHSKTACYYDYDTNNLINLPDMKYERECHSLIHTGGDKVFIIGGIWSKKVSCLDLLYEDYEDYPDLIYDRRDASLCLVNEKLLYVFMGFSLSKGCILDNYEVLNITIKPNKSKWTILPMNNMLNFSAPRVYSGVVYDKKNQEFIFIGGCKTGVMDNKVLKFGEKDFNFWGTDYIMKEKGGFNDTCFIKIGEDDIYYQFSYEDLKLFKFELNNKNIEEIPKEW